MSTQRPHFLTLPPEIRNTIYNYATPTIEYNICDTQEAWCEMGGRLNNGPYPAQLTWTGMTPKHNPHRSLALVNKQIHAEVKQILSEVRVNLKLCSGWCVREFLDAERRPFGCLASKVNQIRFRRPCWLHRMPGSDAAKNVGESCPTCEHQERKAALWPFALQKVRAEKVSKGDILIGVR